jgi:hypothetical protein
MTIHPRSLWSSHIVGTSHDHKLQISPSTTGD